MPDWARVIKDAVAAVERRLGERIKSLVQETPIARSRADRAQRAQSWPSPETTGDRAATRFQHFGFRSRPPVGTNTIMLLVGGAATAGVSVAEDSNGHGPDDLEEGECALYSVANAKAVWIDKDGRVWLLSKSGQDVNITAQGSGVVKVNGGSLEVARKTDPVKLVAGGKQATWMAQVELAITALGGVAPSPPVITFVDSPDMQIADGAARFKA